MDDTVNLLHEVVSIEDQKDTISALMEITLHLAKQVDLLQGTNSKLNASKDVRSLIPHKNTEKPMMMLGFKIQNMLQEY